MPLALRSLLVAVLGILLAPALASAQLSVSMNTSVNVLSMEELNPPGEVDHITVTFFPDRTVVTDSTATPHLQGDGGACLGDFPTSQVTCTPSATSVAANLGGQDDEFRVAAGGIAVPVAVDGGPGNDDLQGGPGNDVLSGGDGIDTLNGLGGIDDYFGGTGADRIEATDGLAERISCGADNDSVHNDFTDIIAECETGIDGDGDGFSSAVDCNDANRAIFPGAREIFSNGIDEDCNGRDDVNLDVDGDRFPRPQDCNDNDPKIRPNAVEVRGNKVDENCDNVASPWLRLPAVVSNRWVVARSFTRLRALIVHNAPRGTRIVFSCRGPSCPFRKTRRETVRSSRPITLSRGISGARLRAGTRFKLAVSASETIGRTYTYSVRSGDLPAVRTVCEAPGEKKGQPC